MRCEACRAERETRADRRITWFLRLFVGTMVAPFGVMVWIVVVVGGARFCLDMVRHGW